MQKWVNNQSSYKKAKVGFEKEPLPKRRAKEYNVAYNEENYPSLPINNAILAKASDKPGKDQQNANEKVISDAGSHHAQSEDGTEKLVTNKTEHSVEETCGVASTEPINPTTT